MAELWKSKNQLIQIMTDVYITLANDSSRMLQVIDTDPIVRALLLPIYGQSKVSELADVRIGF